jgi:hypothetical protein
MNITATQVIAKTILYVTVPDEAVASSQPEALVNAIEPIVAGTLQESLAVDFFGTEGEIEFKLTEFPHRKPSTT